MTITPITPFDPVCYGIACDHHAECARYHAVNGATYEQRIAFCDDLSNEQYKPLFVALEVA